MKPLTYTIIEHQIFGIEEIAKAWTKHKSEECKGVEQRAKKFFKALEEFQKSHEDNCKFLKHYNKHKLKAQNYVGVIQTQYGTLEILPKCFTSIALSDEEDEEKAKLKESKKTNKEALKKFFILESFEKQFNGTPPKIQDFSLFNSPKQSAQNFLLFCLGLLKNLPKSNNLSSLSTTYTPLLEIFMKMFCKELLEVCKRGIRHDYVAIENNRTYLKGKLLFDRQIRHNFVHKERFYTSSDEYIANIAPNRLIKSTLKLIATFSTSHSTYALINQCLEAFEEIPSSSNIDADFLFCTNSRHFSYYEILMEWCKLFLKNKSFAPYSGESQAYTLLFPMEKLFESYVAFMLKTCNIQAHTITPQKSDQFLYYLENNVSYHPRFNLKPDLHIQKEDGSIIIADTKWKVLKNADDKKHGIVQADLYQLFAYAHYYKAQEIWLIYPKLYAQNDKENKEIAQIIDNLQEWNSKTPHYSHPCTFEEKGEHHKTKIKVLFAPLAFY